MSVRWAADEHVNVVLLRTGGIAVAPHLSLNGLRSQSVSLTTLEFSSPVNAQTLGILGWSGMGESVAIVRRPPDAQDKVEVYVLNIAEQEARVYCLPEAIAPSWVVYSPDQRVIGWPVFEANGTASGTVLLDLASGDWAYVEGFKILGWGTVARRAKDAVE